MDVEYELKNEPCEREMAEFFNAEKSRDEDPGNEVRAAHERLIAERPVQASVAVYELGNGSDHFLCRLLPPRRGPNAGPRVNSFTIVEK
jgi:hypothetical protein